ncbi:SGNH/GDSL hydrolase family protein [Duncaniella muricolitica]|jgi:hypothetical protein|uniref:SGNH/GDSL hydrolase family protein n=1 Tax=Duncaniella muricolitica TaxID=2880704 RepID=UPI00244E29E2|nr:SGNH/GDSL hydrolase family protein [Duncaniella muricolitica]
MTKLRFLQLAIALMCVLFIGQPVAAQARHAAKPVVSILGDSYSTFEGYIPVGNAVWYDTRPNPKKTDVSDVKHTWWWQFISRGGYILGVNDSYSGATVSYTGYNGADYSDRSFITRLPRLGSPDILLIFGATNDSWAGVKVGEYSYAEPLSGPQLYEFRPAMARLLSEAVNRYPGTEIYFIINSELRDDITQSIREVCDHYSVRYIQLHDIDKISGHPSRAGMTAIADQLLEAMQ